MKNYTFITVLIFLFSTTANAYNCDEKISKNLNFSETQKVIDDSLDRDADGTIRICLDSGITIARDSVEDLASINLINVKNIQIKGNYTSTILYSSDEEIDHKNGNNPRKAIYVKDSENVSISGILFEIKSKSSNGIHVVNTKNFSVDRSKFNINEFSNGILIQGEEGTTVDYIKSSSFNVAKHSTGIFSDKNTAIGQIYNLTFRSNDSIERGSFGTKGIYATGTKIGTIKYIRFYNTYSHGIGIHAESEIGSIESVYAFSRGKDKAGPLISIIGAKVSLIENAYARLKDNETLVNASNSIIGTINRARVYVSGNYAKGLSFNNCDVELINNYMFFDFSSNNQYSTGILAFTVEQSNSRNDIDNNIGNISNSYIFVSGFESKGIWLTELESIDLLSNNLLYSYSEATNFDNTGKINFKLNNRIRER